MPIPILMPALSPTMEEGTLAKWLVKEGDTVSSGDVIAEIETDKATMEVEAVEEGKVGKILVGEGTANVAVNAPIAVLLEEGEDVGALAGFEAKSGPAPVPAEAGGTQAGPEPARAPVAVPAVPSPVPQANGRGGRIRISPLARRMAAQNHIDLSALSGSGPRGRIVKRDIEKVIADGVPAPPAAATERASAGPLTVPTPAVSDEAVMALYEPSSYEVVPHDNLRRIVADRLSEAKRTIPHFYLSVDCELDALLAARRRLNAMSPEEGPKAFSISVNDLVIKAMAMALQTVPAANVTWTEQGTLYHKSSDICVAVAVEGGLFTPVVRHAEIKSLSEISNEMKDLGARARSRRLAPHEYQGGTTTISNLGMYGVKKFEAVINPPHATILAVGAGEKRAVIRGDEIQVATVMSVTLSCDHRVVDGAVAAALLDALKGFIEEPVTMLV